MLRVLATFEAPERGCWPWRATGNEARCCERTANRALQMLPADGWIVQQACNASLRHRFQCRHGRRGDNHYHLNYYRMKSELRMGNALSKNP